MKNLLMTTAFVALATTPLHAASETETTAAQETESTFAANDNQFGLNHLMGARVYIAKPDAEAAEESAELTEPHESWEDIGEIGEAYLSKEGEVDTLIVDVGGFLGIGERQVEISLDEVTFKPDADDEGSFFVVYNGPRSDLEGKEEFDQASVESREMTSVNSDMAEAEGATEAEAETEMAEAEENAEAEMAEAETEAETEMAEAEENAEAEMAEAEAEAEATAEAVEETAESTTETAAAESDPAVDTEAKTAELTVSDREQLTADDLQGLAVYDSNEEHVGEISELILADDGKITDVVVDVGGFLGIGEKPVAMAFDDLKIMRLTEGDLTAKTAVTVEELEAMESWEG